jgi:fructokinase
MGRQPACIISSAMAGRAVIRDPYAEHSVPSGMPPARVLVVGEVLWDLLPGGAELGGAPLNVGAHLARLGHQARLVSAVGADAPGDRARSAIADLGVDTTLLQSTERFPTGTARVDLSPSGEASFTIDRPAAYDALTIDGDTVASLAAWNAGWICHGTLFPSCSAARAVLERIVTAAPDAVRVYDVNLRRGFDAPPLVAGLLGAADVVKLNETELAFVHAHMGLPPEPEAFCREAAARFSWRAACVTSGARGCALFAGGEYLEAPAMHVDVIDPVGAGDAVTAALIHGLASGWPLDRIANFANRMGAFVTSSPGAIPRWERS